MNLHPQWQNRIKFLLFFASLDGFGTTGWIFAIFFIPMKVFKYSFSTK